MLSILGQTLKTLTQTRFPVLLQCEDASALSLPILRDAAFVPSLHREIASPAHPTAARAWADAGVQSLVQLGWAVAVSALRAVPGGGDAWADVAEEDEFVMDLALDNKYGK